jgi:hypothetical protein
MTINWITKTLVISACVLGISGCATPVDRLAEKPYCHTDRGTNAICTKDVAPSLANDEEAKSFTSAPDALTVYVVRYWREGHHPLDVSVDGGAAMETVPNSMIRLRLKEGTHKLTFSVNGKTFDRTITGAKGEVRLLGITGTDWIWGSSSHAWTNDTDEQVKPHALRSRLIKDKSLL